MKKQTHQKNTLLQAATSQPTNQNLQESIFFCRPKRNSIYFSPTLRCFNFFASAQPTADNQLDSLLQPLTGQCNLTRTTEARTANKVLPKAGLNGFDWIFVQGSIFVLRLNFSAKNPRLRQYPNRYKLF